jgi:N-acetylneuraminic acid mutarotase
LYLLFLIIFYMQKILARVSLAVLVLGLSFSSAIPAFADGTWTPTGSMNDGRSHFTATLLPDGKVLVAGGSDSNGLNPLSSAELYDPTTGTWTPTGSMSEARTQFTATLLPNGKVLVAGGMSGSGATLSSTELYDPTTGTWTPTGSMNVARDSHTATLLQSGKVLVAGGDPFIDSAELYDPSTGTWTPTGSMNTGRDWHTATLLPDGRVLVTGGVTSGTPPNYASETATAELYDPSTGTWTPTGSMSNARSASTATLLQNGKVLVAGGNDVDPSADLYDPSTGTWTPTGSMNVGQSGHTATLLPNGEVLMVGNGAELYNPSSGTWSSTATAMNNPREWHTATLLQNGKVLIAGGQWNGLLASAELYDPVSNNPPVIASIPDQYVGMGGTFHFRIPATDPDSNQILTYSASNLPSGATLDPNTGLLSWTPTIAEVGTHSAITFTVTDNGTPPLSSSATANFYVINSDIWTPTSSMTDGRIDPTATLLPNGKVLVAGGNSGSTDDLASAELYDPGTGTWSPTGSMSGARDQATATLLPNGKVLVAGGCPPGSTLSSAELYDPTTGIWTPTGSMNNGRCAHTATLLPNGKVLVAGGTGNIVAGSTAELYDPSTGTWTPTGSMNNARYNFTATLLPNGKVLVVGDISSIQASTSAELYDPGTGTWSPTGSMHTGHGYDYAALLPNGKVLVAGGSAWNNQVISSAELYDPATGTWTTTGSMNVGRFDYNDTTATLLPNGKVLVAGGYNGPGASYLSSAELYDPSTGTWSNTASMSVARGDFTATLLPNGKVLVARGWGSTNALSSAELYDYTATPSNNPPVLDPIGNQTVLEGQTLQFTLSATDPDGDALTYSASNLPPGATFDPATHVFTWTPSYGQAGNYTNVEFTVTDSGTPMQLADQMITISVGHVNRPPVFAPVGPQQASTTIPLSFTVSATDPDGDAVALSAANAPAGATFNPSTGVFSWTPAYNQAGVYAVTFTATDNGTPAIATSSMNVVISVSESSPTTLNQNLINSITSSNLPASQQNAYLANLRKVPIFIANGQPKAAIINQLNSFIQKLNQDYSQGKLTQAQYNAYLGQAQKIISDLQ